MDYWRKKIILPAAEFDCKMLVFFLLQLQRHSDVTGFLPCMLFLRLMYGLKQMAAMVCGII